jgi:nitrogen fixation/metabolism regulation signal transduction histidine kinase
MSSSAYALIGLTAIVAGLVAVLVFALLRFSSAAHAARSRGTGEDKLSAALQEAVTRLQAQERATAARADASERLSGEIISGLSAGLLVVGLEGEIRILNPAGRRMLNLSEAAPPDV